jgi:hypothetical protein
MDIAAAEALPSIGAPPTSKPLQNTGGSRRKSETPMDRVFRQVMHLPAEDLGIGDEEEDTEADNDVDQLEDDDDGLGDDWLELGDSGGETAHQGAAEGLVSEQDCSEIEAGTGLPLYCSLQCHLTHIAAKPLPRFPIPFEVTCKNGVRDVDGITSHYTFSMFLKRVADTMNTKITHLSSLGYTPSYRPKNPKPKPKYLEDEDGWRKLCEDVHAYITACKAKNRGKGVVKPYVVVIQDLSGSEEEKSNQAHGKKVCLNPFSKPNRLFSHSHTSFEGHGLQWIRTMSTVVQR